MGKGEVHWSNGGGGGGVHWSNGGQYTGLRGEVHWSNKKGGGGALVKRVGGSILV